MMNEVVYNVLRKMVQDPLNWSLREAESKWILDTYYPAEFVLKYKDNVVVNCRIGGYKSFFSFQRKVCSAHGLSFEDVNRIRKGYRHTQAMKIRNLN